MIVVLAKFPPKLIMNVNKMFKTYSKTKAKLRATLTQKKHRNSESERNLNSAIKHKEVLQ